MWQAGPMLVTRIGEGLIAYGRATGGGDMSRWVRMAAVEVANLVASSQGSEQSHVN